MIGLFGFRVLLAMTLTTNYNYRHFTPGRWIPREVPTMRGFPVMREWRLIVEQALLDRTERRCS
jgi:hypothetical protein